MKAKELMLYLELELLTVTLLAVVRLRHMGFKAGFTYVNGICTHGNIVGK